MVRTARLHLILGSSPRIAKGSGSLLRGSRTIPTVGVSPASHQKREAGQTASRHTSALLDGALRKETRNEEAVGGPLAALEGAAKHRSCSAPNLKNLLVGIAERKRYGGADQTSPEWMG